MDNRVYAVDFETYYDKEYTIKTLGVTCYVNDPRFDAYMVSIVGRDENSLSGQPWEWVGDPKDAPWAFIDGATWISHNSSFDEQVFNRLQRDGVVPVGVKPANWWCTANMAAYLQAPRSLAGAVKQLLGEHVDKSVRAAQQGRKATTAELNADPALREYTLKDSRDCLRLWEGFSGQWPEQERRLGRLTYQWGVEGVCVDVEGATKDFESLVTKRDHAKSLVPWRDVAPILSLPAARKHCADIGIWAPDSFAKTDDEAIRWEDEFAEKYPWVKGVRDYRRTNMLAAKYQTLLNRTANGRFSYAMKYCGASPTFRWSGDAGLNMQNLPKGGLFDCDMRGRFIPAPGCVFVVADFAQIEVRTLNYLAGNDAYLDLIRQGYNPYEALAEKMFPPGVLGAEGARGLKKRNKALYAAAKATCLGAGFSMSGKKFAITAPILTGGEYRPTPEEADEAIARYRESNPKVVALWGNLQRGLKASIGETFEITLPSGRVMRYFGVSRIGDKYTANTETGGKRSFLYGGLCSENCAQGMARDILADALLRIHDAGIGRVVWHIHDEVVVEVPKAGAEEFANEIHRIMCISPSWCPTLPLEVEHVITERYCK